MKLFYSLSLLLLFLVGVLVYLYPRSKAPETVVPVFPTDQKEIHYTLITAPNGKYTYPIVADYSDREAMDKVNQTLSGIFKNFGCDESDSDIAQALSDGKASWDIKVSVDYAKNNIFSIRERGSYYCGGMYPTNTVSDGLIFDMKSGEQVRFQNLFKNYEMDKDNIINTVYGDMIMTAKDLTINDTERGACADSYTSESLTSIDHSYSFSPSVKTITIKPDFPPAAEGCSKEFEIPIQKLLPFIDANSIVNRI
ncbi:MAG: hypothetical protein HZA35_01390 [Parcubacteria group bacterium]|nr:hypothetical protein [Parcubacteria group bacterium]